MFHRDSFRVLEVAPSVASARCRFWDCAATSGGGDYTVGTKVARLPDGSFVVEHVVRGQWDPAQVDKIMRQTAMDDGRSVQVREEQEPGSSGKAVIANRAKLLAGFDYKGLPATGDKETRWRPLAAQAGAGNVAVVRGPWLTAWLDELVLVPYGRHDDQADSAAGAFNALTMHKPVQIGGMRWGYDQ